MRVTQLAGYSARVGVSFRPRWCVIPTALICHSDRREESKTLSRCTVLVPKESPDKKEFRFLAPLGMTYNRMT